MTLIAPYGLPCQDADDQICDSAVTWCTFAG